MIELFACHLFNVNKEQVLLHRSLSSPPSQIFINKLEEGNGAGGGWRARRVEEEWVIKAEERGAAAFGEREPSRFWCNWRVVEIFITDKGA